MHFFSTWHHLLFTAHSHDIIDRRGFVHTVCLSVPKFVLSEWLLLCKSFRCVLLLPSSVRWARVGDRNRGYATQTGKACKINVVSASNEMSSALFVRNLSST